MKVLVGPNPHGLEEVLDDLGRQYADITFAHCAENAGLISAIEDATVYMGWITREQFLAADKIEWIQSPSSGVDKFLAVPELKSGNVLLTSAVGTHAHVLADHAMGMILSFTRGLKKLASKQKSKEWYPQIRAKSRELRGLTISVVGFGNSGQQVAHRAAAFGMRILAVDVADKIRPDYVERIGGPKDLDDTIAQSDVVVVTSPYTEKNRGLIGEMQFSVMKEDALLIGISRGGVIDENALLKALQAHRIEGAALDVFDDEPLPADHPLWDQENLIITPHSAGGTQYEVEGINGIFKENLTKFLADDLPLRNQVDKERGW
jgi:phosphoglycerate dehydrogenase-like enzyme